MSSDRRERRDFIKKCVIGGCGLWVGAEAVRGLLVERESRGLRVGFRNDAPPSLWKWSREADWYERAGNLVRCKLCPHDCLLGENDRGFCRARVVKGGRLHTVSYGNPCAIHLDPVEKKPLYHFLPATKTFSIATAGCNLRCLNCQNWEISQRKPEQTVNADLLPAAVVAATAERGFPSISYTYSEPLIFYEYTRDTARLAAERGIRNILVTASYLSEAPLRELCRVSHAATVDLKGFSDALYTRLTGARLGPVLRCLEILVEEGVWLELSRLVVPRYSDDLEDIRAMCRWIASTLGRGVPLHFLRFHPAYRLERLPPTPVATLDAARAIALEEGLRFVYVGNVPGHPAQDTVCPKCGRAVIERRGMEVTRSDLREGRCPCGEAIPGVWL